MIMSDIWKKDIDPSDFRSIIDICFNVKNIMYQTAFDDFIEMLHIQSIEDVDVDLTFESGFMAGIVATIGYLKEGCNDE